MLHKAAFALSASLLLALPAVAQTTDASTGRSPQELYQRGYAATPMPNQAAIDAQSRPAVAALNDASATASTVAGDVRAAQTDMDRAQYDADRAAYMAALIRHDAGVDRTNARYARQQTAYADAMAAWRAQVAACKRGNSRACNAPTPNPADFY